MELFDRIYVMSFALQIIFLVFGAIEILTNGYYLISQDTVRLGRRHHSELPKTASDKDVINKRSPVC